MTDHNPRARATGACAPCHALPARALAALLLAGGIAGVHAQSWPAKPVRLVVSFAPGGANDILGRAIAQQLTEQFGQQVVVENRAGAGGAVGTEFVAKAPPDGYTLLLGTSSAFAIIPHLSKPNYDAQKDFAPIAPFATLNYVILAHPSVPVKTVKDLVALAKKSPGRFNFASSGNGSAPHLAVELFNAQAGIKLVHIPYKGGAPALTALMGGEVDLMFDTFITALPHVKSGRTRPLAVTSARRAATFPDLPTVAESGLPGYEAGNWFALFAPAGTPSPIIDRAAQAVAKATAASAFRERLAAQGAEPMTGTPESLAALVKTESARFARLIRDAAIRAE
jgi:tripartite-type tricarboxylate transporter receptor subunit TctC